MDERVVKIVKSGWETYTGPFGFVSFKDGVSTKAHPQREYDRVAVELPIVDAETGEPLGIQARMINAHHFRLENPKTHEQKVAEKVAREQAKASTDKQAKPTPQKVYSGEELEEIATKGGISALRRIAEPLKVKGRAIPELMAAIAKAQSLLGKPA